MFVLSFSIQLQMEHEKRVINKILFMFEESDSFLR